MYKLIVSPRISLEFVALPQPFLQKRWGVPDHWRKNLVWLGKSNIFEAYPNFAGDMEQGTRVDLSIFVGSVSILDPVPVICFIKFHHLSSASCWLHLQFLAGKFSWWIFPREITIFYWFQQQSNICWVKSPPLIIGGKKSEKFWVG